MKRADVIVRLKQLEPRLRGMGVDALFLYGSHARDEAGAESDIDVFVDPVARDRFGFRETMAVYAELEDAFPGMEIGYGARENIEPVYRSEIESTAIRVF